MSSSGNPWESFGPGRRVSLVCISRNPGFRQAIAKRSNQSPLALEDREAVSFYTDYRFTASTWLNLEPLLASFSMAQSTEEKEDRKNEFTEDIRKAEESNASAEGIESDEDISTIVTGSRLALIFWQALFFSPEANFIQLQ